MARQKKFKRVKLPPFLDDLRDAAVKKSRSMLLIIILIFAVVFMTKMLLYKSDYFNLRAVETRGAFLDHAIINSINSQLLNSYKGRNVFRINLKYVEESLRYVYPDARDLSLNIALPDKIVVKIKFRKPVALVRSERFYPVDEDGVVLFSADASSAKGLPVIEGIDLRYMSKDSRRGAPKNLKFAIELLKEIKRSKELNAYGVDTIDAGDLRNMSFYLKNGVEIRIGPEKFRERIQALEKTLRNPRLILAKIKYIDLRFADVVIGPKE